MITTTQSTHMTIVEESEDQSSLQSANPPIAIMQQPETPQFQPSRLMERMNSRLSTLSFSAILQSAPANGGRLSGKHLLRHLSRRQIAEVQLHSLLHEPEVALPLFAQDVNEMSLEELSKLLNTQPFIIERLLNALSPESGGGSLPALSKSDVLTLIRVLNGSLDVRALLYFMMLDKDGDDYVTTNDFVQFYEYYLKNIKLLSNDRVQEVIQALLQGFQLETNTRIDFEEFHSVVTNNPSILEVLSRFTIPSTCFVPRTSTPPTLNFVQRIFACLCLHESFHGRHKSKLTREYLYNNLARVTWISIYILLNFALLLYVAIYQSTVTKLSAFGVIARICGMLLNLNCTLIIILMFKQTILFIRSKRLLYKFLPVDDHIDFHQIIGRFIAALVIIHTVAHVADFGLKDNYSWGTLMFTTSPGIGWVSGSAPLSGLILCIILAIIVICSMQWIRRGKHFQIFYWTHLMYIPFFVLLIIHAGNFWKWIIAPLSWLLLEKFYSIVTRYAAHIGRTYLDSVTIEQSNVVSLTIRRPKNFTFQPGDYISINLPSITPYEFHPFTISSAPENMDHLSVHIQAIGNWTNQVHKRFMDMSGNSDDQRTVKVFRCDQQPNNVVAVDNNVESLADVIIDTGAEHQDERNDNNVDGVTTQKTKREWIIINGPYSSCARYVFDCKHVVLIAGGIGVTPYASILSSLMAQFVASRSLCKHCQGINYNNRNPFQNYRLKKIDFIWVNRDQKSVEWFLNLLRQFEEEQEAYLTLNTDTNRFLDIHLYFTDIKHDRNIGNVPLDLASTLWTQVTGNDIFTNLRARTQTGRPKWDEIFAKLVSSENSSTANDVSVFFCGPPTMGRTIKKYCRDLRFQYYEEKF